MQSNKPIDAITSKIIEGKAGDNEEKHLNPLSLIINCFILLYLCFCYTE